jgi:hypothetical protein
VRHESVTGAIYTAASTTLRRNAITGLICPRVQTRESSVSTSLRQTQMQSKVSYAAADLKPLCSVAVSGNTRCVLLDVEKRQATSISR